MYQRARGVGVYPDSICFDPQRPGILPYFLDDFQESACKINLLLCGNTTCGNQTAQAEQSAAGATVILPTGSTIPGAGVAVINPTPANPFDPMNYLPWLILAGVVGGLFLFKGKG